MHITNQKWSYDIWNYEIFLNILMIFGIKTKSIILTHTIFVAIATSLAQRLKTGFVLQGHIYGLKSASNAFATHWQI